MPRRTTAPRGAIPAALVLAVALPPAGAPAAGPTALGIGRPRPAAPDKGRLMIVAAEDYKLALDRMQRRAEVELAEFGRREYSFTLAGRVAAPRGIDAVAFTRRLEVLRVLDAEGKDILQRKGPGRTGGMGFGRARPPRYKPETFASLRDRKGQFEVPETHLTRDAYTIETLELGAAAILAEERTARKFPLSVMAEPVELTAGLRVRILSLKLSAQRKLGITVDCSRPKAGPVGPFVEAVAVLDENEETLAAGRWDRGDPFGQKVTLTAELPIPAGRTQKYINFVICTKYTQKPLRFVVRGLIPR